MNQYEGIIVAQLPVESNPVVEITLEQALTLQSCGDHCWDDED